MGILASGRQKDVDDYFTAGGSMGGWLGTILVGLSIAASLFSGISFLFYPAVVYSGGIVLFIGVTFVCMPIAYLTLLWFLPRYLGHGGTHPYEIIESTFGSATRTAASITYVLMRIGWMSALIYAPTLAIMAAAGLSSEWFWPCILVTGSVSTLYTAFGGIRGVIVTDAVQFVIVILGISLTFACVWKSLPVPFGEALRVLKEAGRLDFLPLSIDPRVRLTVWTVAIGVSVANLANYIGDQMALQRYLATREISSALRSFRINVFGVILVIGLLSGIGLTMFVFYHFHPDPMLPTEADKIYPHFIATQLPVGISGLVLAAILAATMSSMTSGINAISSTITLDLLPRIAGPLSPARQLRFARTCSSIVGIVATILAGFVHRLGTLFDLTQIILGVFAGPLLVVVIMATARSRVSANGIITGLIAGCVAGWVAAFSPIASLWIAPIAATSTLLVAYLSPFSAAKVRSTT